MPSTSEYRARPDVREKAKAYDRKYRSANRAAINERARLNKAMRKEASGVNAPAAPKRNRSHEEERASIRAYLLKKKYGLSMEQWDSLFTKQGKACAICRSPNPTGSKGWHTDHCHSTGKVRGILCSICNTTLGQLKEDVDTMQRMIEYVEMHRG